MTADESGFMPVLHMPDATYYVSDSAESDKRETQNALRMSDSPETDMRGDAIENTGEVLEEVSQDTIGLRLKGTIKRHDANAEKQRIRRIHGT